MSFDDLLKDLQGQNTVQEDPNHVALDVLFNESFMGEHSNCKTFEAFLEKGNFQVKTREDIHNIPDELFDRHVARETDFDNWKSMLDTATMKYAVKSDRMNES
ncbi:hypothetical protein ACFQI7_25705 [Paenibacillus allorhizosphaerae]|uniref:Uncharacterized protein n=1 Tax=Paenibacillus allorhizosphaerae TaxID=2849866 RepID=A0ABM8VJG9_9BACL|nr:hypothetical protein [Paenibacillus allorhizosphaerae]CAG7645449.1 hypothetical protein PAECIP111802_03519 [Paenibacillus allorhizosphaerae]